MADKLRLVWRKLGILLGLDFQKLKQIDWMTNRSFEDCCLEMLHRWLSGQGSEPTWEKLIEAVRKLEEIDVAAELEKFVSSKH